MICVIGLEGDRVSNIYTPASALWELCPGWNRAGRGSLPPIDTRWEGLWSMGPAPFGWGCQGQGPRRRSLNGHGLIRPGWVP